MSGLASGTRLGSYEVRAPLGAGGMGEVYRATDTKLGRDVALKVLPENFANDADRMARFQREAQVLASLNHPNIAAIYGLEESGGVRALVMELVEGPTLAERLSAAPAIARYSRAAGNPAVSSAGTVAMRASPLRVEEALHIARQIAGALEYAHDRGIIHRDLKPANVKITPEGTVKVLDFGLAKALGSGDSASTLNPNNSPTLTAAATQAGVILGTAAYMSPEQAKGKPVDRRADIWAFGCVMYEMLTGRQAFEGETVSDLLAAVIMKDPDWDAVPASTPASIRKLLRRCLDKDVRRRLQAIGEARVAMENPEDDQPGAAASAVSGPSASPRSWLRWGVPGILLGALITGILLRIMAPQPPPRKVERVSILLPSTLTISTSYFTELALSPDGSDLVFSAKEGDKTQLYRRPLDRLEATPIPDTDGGVAPFFSPDGSSLAFIYTSETGTTLALKRVPLRGGPVQSLCTVYNNFPGSWALDGTIFFSTSHRGGLVRVSSSGGNCEDLTTPDQSQGEVGHGMPQILPGGQSILFEIQRGFTAEQSAVALLSLKTKKWQTLIHDGTNPHYVPGGFLVYVRRGSLLAVPFDLSSLKVTGSPAPVLENLMTDPESGVAQLTFSLDGTLAYIAGGAGETRRKVLWVDREGKSQDLTQNDGAYEDLDLSPDGHRIAMTIEGSAWNIWIYDIARATLSRFTFDNDNRDPLWSPDGKHVAYTSFRNGKYGIYWKLSDGSGQEEQLMSSQDWATATSFSPDGQELVYNDESPETGMDIALLPLEGQRKSRPLIHSKFSEQFGSISPDGHWLAYQSDETGRDEIYVQQYPGLGGKRQISNAGGSRAVWSRDAREIFYLSGNKLMAVPVETRGSFTPGTPHALATVDYFASGHCYDVLPDGKQFLFIKEAEQARESTQINVVFNWFDELKRLMAAQKQ
ncbi:MAG TPA: protein kinase [Terriglobia bacterium]|nr:protein kinase [Terriglobia bacterium]